MQGERLGEVAGGGQEAQAAGRGEAREGDGVGEYGLCVVARAALQGGLADGRHEWPLRGLLAVCAGGAEGDERQEDDVPNPVLHRLVVLRLFSRCKVTPFL